MPWLILANNYTFTTNLITLGLNMTDFVKDFKFCV